ncbi:MAG: 50S ribosomal protein L11 methyltransferase [Candidatus Omnitrophica bacterium]|nr:50S ribosomal protein L11 methyltransferase [Candidatus Omnitrophota bacterium]
MTAKLNKKLFEIFCIIKSANRDQADLVAEFLFSIGANYRDVTVLTKKGIFRISIYFKNQKKAENFKTKLDNFRLKGVSFKLREVKIENWKEKWAKNFSPFQLTKTIDVVPTWRKKSYKKTKRTPIYLSSINAFGTGLHETTSFMAELVEQKKDKFSSFFDIGTGTGLLALVALHNGAKDVLAIDFNQDCVKSAKENFEVNKSKALIQKADIGEFKIKKVFDFVAANLITHDLTKFKRELVSFVGPRGFLAISGISLENLSLIKETFRALPLRCIKIKRGKQWVALLYKRA